MSHGPSNGNPFSLVWSVSLRREACRHAELNPPPAIPQQREDKQAAFKVRRPKWTTNNVFVGRFHTKGSKKEKSCFQLIASQNNDPFGDNCLLMHSVVGLPALGGWKRSIVSERIYLIWIRRATNMRQNADPGIINIYIHLKPGRIGFWGWPFSVMYAFWLLIVTLPQSERQTVNTFEVNLLTGDMKGGPWRSVSVQRCKKKKPSYWALQKCFLGFLGRFHFHSQCIK